MPRMNMVQALNAAMDVMMARDENVVVFGEDVGYFGGGSTDVGASLMASLVIMRRNALAELKEAVYACTHSDATL